MTKIPDSPFLAFPEESGQRCITLDGKRSIYIPYRLLGKGFSLDSVSYHENGTYHDLFRIEDKTITIILTNRCNQKCIMCPQRLGYDSINHDAIIDCFIENFSFNQIDSLYVTGGEPFLKSTAIDALIEKVPTKKEIVILTNGTIKPSEKILSAKNVTLCIPLYGSYDKIHNYLTGSSFFYQTLDNLLYYSAYFTPIELRFVVTKYNYQNIPEFVYFAQKNLPFVARIALMGIELVESAQKNSDALWIDPRQYAPLLEYAIEYLNDFDIPVAIYNLQPCLFSPRYRQYVKQTISNWKRSYAPCCTNCSLRPNCGGFFNSDYAQYINLVKEPIS